MLRTSIYLKPDVFITIAAAHLRSSYSDAILSCLLPNTFHHEEEMNTVLLQWMSLRFETMELHLFSPVHTCPFVSIQLSLNSISLYNHRFLNKSKDVTITVPSTVSPNLSESSFHSRRYLVCYKILGGHILAEGQPT